MGTSQSGELTYSFDSELHVLAKEKEGCQRCGNRNPSQIPEVQAGVLVVTRTWQHDSRPGPCVPPGYTLKISLVLDHVSPSTR